MQAEEEERGWAVYGGVGNEHGELVDAQVEAEDEQGDEDCCGQQRRRGRRGVLLVEGGGVLERR